MAEATRERVREVAKRLGYRNNPLVPAYAAQIRRSGSGGATAGNLVWLRSYRGNENRMQGWLHRICNGDDMQVHGEYLAGRDGEAWGRLARPPAMWSLAQELLRAGPGCSPYAVSDELNTAGACAFLEEYFVSPHYQRATPQRPLLLKLSLQQPHYPFCAPEDRIAHYLPLLREYENQSCLEHPEFRNWTANPEGVSREDRRRALAATAAMVEICDAHFGRVMAQIAACGQNLDDWLVIYCSDHGDLLGEHGKWWKLSFYEGSVKVPLVLRAPRLFPGGGRRIAQNVNLCDLFATLSDAAGLPGPADTDTRSLLPLLRGTAADWPDESVSQYYGRCLMIKRSALKYQYYGPDPAGPEVLFDLTHDPGETRNVIADPAYADDVEGFRRRRDELGFGEPG